MSRVSDNITRIRLKRKLTEGELADKLSVAAETVIGWESGANTPDIEELREITDVLNVDITALIDGYPGPAAPKRGVRQLLISCGIALLLGITAYYLTPLTERFKGQMYNLGPVMLMQAYLLPAFWLVLGWAVMQGAGMLGLVRQGRSGLRRPIHIALLVLVLLYALLTLPFIADQLINLAEHFRFRQNPSLYPDGLQYVSHIPDILMNIAWRIVSAVYNSGAVFLLPGILYWLTGPAKPKANN